MRVLGTKLASHSFEIGHRLSLPRLSHHRTGKPLSTSTVSPLGRHLIQHTRTHATMNGHGDLSNFHAMRPSLELAVDPAYIGASFGITADEDEPAVRGRYRPFLLPENDAADDWVAQLELSTALKLVESEILEKKLDRLRILVLYGSLRDRSYSRLLAYEASRILFRLGCDVRVYDPAGLPQKDDVQHIHPKVQELRELSKWSDGHVWISPEQHGNLTGIFKQQIDWIPLSTGSVRPTQGRTLAIAQVSGGSQSFNAVNSLRILGRWMRMFTIPNQSSVPQAYTQFTPESEGSRMIPSSNRGRLVDCMEELVKYTIAMRPHFDLFGDRFSEREERRLKQEKAEADQTTALSGSLASGSL
ncbi:arsenic resistance protein [Ophiostoma piceae UAMH 11346]|uniref:Arsenic resistance protein n=1 Tax=Ophiostoma piceae (strain UAMH 11346) TaxID=1262450 RepID=S3CU65_OPHP1|nr:arsenic resistance protein [Ophiostoma piceae UAMH 11346]